MNRPLASFAKLTSAKIPVGAILVVLALALSSTALLSANKADQDRAAVSDGLNVVCNELVRHLNEANQNIDEAEALARQVMNLAAAVHTKAAPPSAKREIANIKEQAASLNFVTERPPRCEALVRQATE